MTYMPGTRMAEKGLQLHPACPPFPLSHPRARPSGRLALWRCPRETTVRGAPYIAEEALQP